MCNVSERSLHITSETLHHACSSAAGEECVALGHGVKRKHSQESVESLAKQYADTLLLFIWAEVRWCSAAWDGRSGQSCWRGGSCSPPLSWAPGRPSQ